MQIRNIAFSNCFLSAGSLNFFRDGYWYDDWFKVLVPGFKMIDKISFVAKTTTLNPRIGNMPLDKNFRPQELKPECIKVYPFSGTILNAVGLSGPGAKVLFEADKWQKLTQPFFISFMAVGLSQAERIDEMKGFVDLLSAYLDKFAVPIGLQINVSCPNAGHNTADLAREAIMFLEQAASLGIPIDLKVNTLVRTEVVREVQDSRLCDVLTISNTIPYGTAGVNWEKLFHQKQSPLQKFGGGGLSGKVILPLVLRKISELRSSGIILPFKGSGGILRASDVEAMKMAGANAVEIGSVLILRPWRAKGIIEKAESIF
jgi:dihydroorotate dehydrogenase